MFVFVFLHFLKMIIGAVIIFTCLSITPIEAYKKMPLINDDQSQQKPMGRQGKRMNIKQSGSRKDISV